MTGLFERIQTILLARQKQLCQVWQDKECRQANIVSIAAHGLLLLVLLTSHWWWPSLPVKSAAQESTLHAVMVQLPLQKAVKPAPMRHKPRSAPKPKAKLRPKPVFHHKAVAIAKPKPKRHHKAKHTPHKKPVHHKQAQHPKLVLSHKQLESDMQRALKAEQRAAEKARQQAQKHQALLAQQAKYQQLIIQAISQHWLVPHGIAGMHCELAIALAPDGAVLDASLLTSSGSKALDNSALAAVLKSSPLPVPQDPEAFTPFRHLHLTVRPTETTL